MNGTQRITLGNRNQKLKNEIFIKLTKFKKYTFYTNFGCAELINFDLTSSEVTGVRPVLIFLKGRHNTKQELRAPMALVMSHEELRAKRSYGMSSNKIL